MEENKKNYYPCAYCGKLVYRKPSRIKKENIKNVYCCVEHMGLHRKQTMIGKNNPNYNNIRRKDGDICYKNGYVFERKIGHPFSDEDGWVRQHRLIAEQYLLTQENSIEVDGNKYLSPKYEAHHINEIKTDNRVENLLICTKSEHMHIHHGYKKEYIPHPREKKTSFEFTCPVCKTIFYSSNKNRKCCSVKCSNILNNRGSVEIICDMCGRKRRIKKSVYEKSEKHFCSRKCYYDYRRLK